tara:strand:- start:330 stop:2036 length:1707 start_codon:yes stop_codon:yes gene_type:complete
MGVLDFLFQGAPPASVTTYGETTSNVPAWYSDYTQGLISRANSIAAEPYQPYSQARIAGFDPLQNQAYTNTANLSGQYQPLMDMSKSAIYNAGAGSSLNTAQPYINQALQYNPYTAASGSIGQASNLIGQSYGNTSSLAQPYFNQANQLTGQATQGTAGLAQPYFNQANAYTQQGAAGTAGLATPYLQQAALGTNMAGSANTAALANPYMQQASQLSGQGAQTGLGGIQDYMNPYQDQVVNRIGELGARNLRENLLPNIQDRAIQAGTFGGSRSGEAIGRALRDTQESTLAQQSQALQSGYSQAGQQLQADRARQLQAAQQQAGFGQQAAGLSAADFQRMLSASGQQAQIGQSMAGLSSADQQRLLAAGQQSAAFGQAQAGMTSADYQRMLAGAQQQAAMGQSQAGLAGADLARYGQAGAQMGALGQMQGNLAGAAGTQNLQAAQQMGTLSNQDFARMLQSGQAMGALGQQTQQMGMQNIAALEAAGAGQQQQTQRSLDQAYQDFLNQREYDRNNIAFLNASVRGLQVPTSTTSASTGPASVYQPSPLSQLGSTLASGYGLSKLFGKP